MPKGDPAPRLGGHRISAGRLTNETALNRSHGRRKRARLLRIGAAVGFGAKLATVNLQLSAEGRPHNSQARLELMPAPSGRARRRNGPSR